MKSYLHTETVVGVKMTSHRRGCVGNQVQSDSIFLNTMHNNLHYGRDWTTGLDFWTHPNCKIHLIQCRTEAKRTYSLSYFANTALY